ncbi:hypothetical protein L6452_13664 [Arctium lappa]|uniref:Uncharacterized protein n=1 Tax=Arctium lappa TaxID=4217 RepID=A0ACB9CIV5_ARCLA|nr:hypothetical protein L6452_13664 [Arctium lappa]
MAENHRSRTCVEKTDQFKKIDLWYKIDLWQNLVEKMIQWEAWRTGEDDPVGGIEKDRRVEKTIQGWGGCPTPLKNTKSKKPKQFDQKSSKVISHNLDFENIADEFLKSTGQSLQGKKQIQGRVCKEEMEGLSTPYNKSMATKP